MERAESQTTASENIENGKQLQRNDCTQKGPAAVRSEAKKKGISTFESLKARDKACPLSAMNLKSKDINLLYAPFSDSIGFKRISFIKKCSPTMFRQTSKCV